MNVDNLIKEFGDSNENWLILEFLTGIDRNILKLDKSFDVSKFYASFLEIKKKRDEHYPLQYIFGKWDFYGLELFVSENALIPRYETEILVDEILKLDCKKDKILDIGIGTGAISLALASNLPNSTLKGVDISPLAIELANNNKEKLNLKNVEFFESDLFENVNEKFDLIVSNPPYIDKDDMNTLERELSFEPYNALFGGDDGLYFYREIISKARDFLFENGVLAFEIGYNQKDAVCEMMCLNGFEIILTMKDFSNFDRIVIGRKV